VEEKMGIKLSKNVGLFDPTLLNPEESSKIIQQHLESLVTYLLIFSASKILIRVCGN
jgi:hypothetical protein